DPAAPSQLLDYLRRLGSYLTPGGGMQLLPVIAVVLRSLVLYLLLTWLPMVTVLMIGLRGVYYWLSEVAHWHGHGRLEPWMFPVFVALNFVALALLFSLFAGIQSARKRDTPYRVRRGFERIAPRVLWPLVVLGVLVSLPYVQDMVGEKIRKEGLAVAV